ncbi:Hsp70 protein-domain-containing protein [Phakopsora pachyrhizi]|nr:Hsp70 protein-domain-containing protein [Phakopsora pachyrhizi]
MYAFFTLEDVQLADSSFLHRKEPNKSINPDEAVSYGAAVQAAILTGETSEKTQGLLLLDVAPLLMGIKTAGEVFTSLIKRITTVPTKKGDLFNLCQRPAGSSWVSYIEVTFDIEVNGILNVSATKKTTEDIEHIVNEVEKYKAEDEAAASRIQVKNVLELYSYNLRKTIEGDLKDKLDAGDKAIVEKEIKKTLSWLDAFIPVNLGGNSTEKKKIMFDKKSMPDLHAKINREFKHLLLKMLVTKPENCAMLHKVLDHAWMINGKEGLPDPQTLSSEPLSLTQIYQEIIKTLTGFKFGTVKKIKANSKFYSLVNIPNSS